MWKRKRSGLYETYRELWRFHSYHMLLAHVVVAGVVAFLISLDSYEHGEIGWFWPAISLAVAFFACLALFIPGEDKNEPWL